jgi:hypothetical protein
MSTVTIAYIKQYFPLWNKFFLDDNNTASDTVLQNELDQAEVHLKEFINFPEPITDQVKRYVLIITRYFGFVRRHGHEEFDKKPQIVKDYEELILMLKAFVNGQGTLTPVDTSRDGLVGIESKDRIFGEWFNDPYQNIRRTNKER